MFFDKLFKGSKMIFNRISKEKEKANDANLFLC